MTKIFHGVAVLIFSSLFFVHASDDVGHFKAIESKDIPSALCNLNIYNAELEQIIEGDNISTENLVRVHELTYTLEKAIQKIQSELTKVAVDLEEVHLASESVDEAKVKSFSDKYIEQMTLLLTPPNCDS